MYCRFCWRWRNYCSDFNPILARRGNISARVDGLVFKLQLVPHLWLHVADIQVAAIYALLLLVGEGTIWPVCDVRWSCIMLLLQLLPFRQGSRALHVVPAWCPAYNRQLLRGVGITCSRLRRACSMSLATPMAWAGSLAVAVYAAPPLLWQRASLNF